MSNLFKKAAVFTDIHFGLKSNSIQHNTDCANFVEWFIQTAKAEGCETCFFLGDYNHNRAAINIQTLQFGLRALERLSQSFDQVFFIAGNHDLYFRDKRDVHSVEWAKHLPNVRIIDQWFEQDDVIIAPWLCGEDWKTLEHKQGKYLFGHFELPHFYMNAMIQMPDHNELQANHLKNFESVFSGHFHKRQQKGNITYIGNAFPHNFADVDDDERGMMVLEWGTEPVFYKWDAAPKFRIFSLSSILEEPEKLLVRDSYVKINLDVDISFEESTFLRESLVPQYGLREMSLIPVRADLETDSTDYTNVVFESVDTIIQKQIEDLLDGSYDKKLLLEIYRSL
jgi:DNA repair exonuclease SbcCD nuclease subunit